MYELKILSSTFSSAWWDYSAQKSSLSQLTLAKYSLKSEKHICGITKSIYQICLSMVVFLLSSNFGQISGLSSLLFLLETDRYKAVTVTPINRPVSDR